MKVLKGIGFVAAAFVLTLVAQGIWSGLLALNLKTGLALPWAAPVALGLLWLGWRFAGGERPGPVSETAQRRRRAGPVAPRTMAWALVANALSLVALGGLWVVLRHLVKTPGNPAPDFSAYPPAAAFVVLATAAIVGAVSEEVGLRGYIQGGLEAVAPWPVAVLTTALIAAPAHASTQGFVWPTMLFYLLSDAVFGVTARLAGSIRPTIVAHAAGLFLFFLVIWPHDATRTLVTPEHPDPGVWRLAAVSAVFALLTVAALVRLGAVRRSA
jgi:membrane protease YdiL (CAAX protease family)